MSAAQPPPVGREELDRLLVDRFAEAVRLRAAWCRRLSPIRGGRSGEVQDQINGIPVNDPLIGSAAKPLPPRGQAIETPLDVKMAQPPERRDSAAEVLHDKKDDQERWPISVGGTDPVNGQAYDAMFFQHYGVNPFVDPQRIASRPSPWTWTTRPTRSRAPISIAAIYRPLTRCASRSS